jgi:hypothetical protein
LRRRSQRAEIDDTRRLGRRNRGTTALRAGTIAVQLQLVIVGVSNEQRLAHPIVNGSIELNPSVFDAKERVAERDPIRIPNRESLRRRAFRSLAGVEGDEGCKPTGPQNGK